MSQPKPLFLFDVDKTLIDTPKLFGQKMVVELKKTLQLSDQEYQQREDAYQQSLEKYTDFDPVNYLSYIAESADVEELAKQTVFNPEFHQSAVFPDAISTIEALQDNFVLGIFSEAVEYWQRKKLELSGLLPYFDQDYVFIWRRKTDPEKLAQLPAGTGIVDDNPTVVAELLLVPTLNPVWLNRVNDPTQLTAPTISSLAELPVLLSKRKTL